MADRGYAPSCTVQEKITHLDVIHEREGHLTWHSTCGKDLTYSIRELERNRFSVGLTTSVVTWVLHPLAVVKQQKCDCFFEGVDRKRSYRDVIGHSTRMDRTRYWHYGIGGLPDVLYRHMVTRAVRITLHS